MFFYYEKVNDTKYKLTTQVILNSNVTIHDLPSDISKYVIEIDSIPTREEGKDAELYYDVNSRIASYEYSQQITLEEQIDLIKLALNDLIFKEGV